MDEQETTVTTIVELIPFKGWRWRCELCAEQLMPRAGRSAEEVLTDALYHEANERHRMNEVHESRSSRRG